MKRRHKWTKGAIDDVARNLFLFEQGHTAERKKRWEEIKRSPFEVDKYGLRNWRALARKAIKVVMDHYEGAGR